MRVLLLTAADRQPELSTLYQALARHLPIEVQRLDEAAQYHLSKTLANLDVSRFQRVLLHLPFERIQGQVRCLQRLPGLVIYEENACQNYVAGSALKGRFSRFYRRLPQARVVVTSASVAERLRAEGVCAHFLAKGFDPKQLFSQGLPRDIELGFVECLSSPWHLQRKALLERLAEVEPLQLLRSEPGEAYRQMLNRIQVFVSADIGLGEYMAKNVEAMACGCAVVAWRQGVEEAAIGLDEGKHLLLYSSLTELRCHLARLRREPWLRQSLAQYGREFVQQHLSYEQMAVGLSRVLRQPAREVPEVVPWQQGWVQKMALALQP